MNTVKIKSQNWMAENLNVETFSNGDPISHANTTEEWVKAGQEGKPAWCFYGNDPANSEKYGRLYNWYAVNDPRGLAPEGWHIPSKEDWDTLLKSLGNDTGEDACSKLKSKAGWPDGKNGKNQSGFGALPGGYRFNDGSFEEGGKKGYWWSSSDNPTFTRFPAAEFVFIREYERQADSDIEDKGHGMSVRCIKK
jgi:uncharacterized protein (TIGR02145 family)